MKFNLINDDCLKALKNIEDSTIDLVVTDPPYDIHAGIGGGSFGKRNSYQDILSMSNGFNLDVLSELTRVMKKTNIYMFCSLKQIPVLYDYFVNKLGCNWGLLEWHKTNPVPACHNKYLNDTEYIFFAREKGVKIYGNYHTKKTFWITKNNVKEKREFNHPTVKPVSIMSDLIENSSLEGQLILDPFMGSGSTGVSSISKGRNFIGIEINSEYVDIAKKRILSI